jgi:hypothetical protein
VPIWARAGHATARGAHGSQSRPAADAAPRGSGTGEQAKAPCSTGGSDSEHGQAICVDFSETTSAITTRTGSTRASKIRQRTEPPRPALHRTRKLWGFRASEVFTIDTLGRWRRRITRRSRSSATDLILRTNRLGNA